MDPSEFADDELEMWQEALSDQREAERQLEQARRGSDPASYAQMLNRLEELRVRADLLLAEAVALKASYRDSVWAKLKRGF